MHIIIKPGSGNSLSSLLYEEGKKNVYILGWNRKDSFSSLLIL